MVGLLTLDSKTYNYGGFLQGMALQDAIISLVENCEVLDYDIGQELYTFSIKRDIRNFTVAKLMDKILPHNVAPISDEIKHAIQERKLAFDLYRKESYHFSKKLSYADLHSDTLAYEQLVCGSDQIWNPDYNILPFFLNFGSAECNKIIYAASIGRDYLTRREKNVYKQLLKYPRYISVREKSAQDIIAGLTSKPVHLVLDPTLLHQKHYWHSKANQSKLNYDNYIFCYFLEMTEEKIKAANAFAKKNQCSVIAIPYLHNQDETFSKKLDGRLISNVNPADFLHLIRNANAVLTDSFHAVVFSIIFQKDFWCFGRNAGVYTMNTRLNTLLSYFGLQEKLIHTSALQNKQIGQISIDFQELEMKRLHSIDFLSKALLKK